MYFSTVLSSVVTPTQSGASTYGIVVDRPFFNDTSIRVYLITKK